MLVMLPLGKLKEYLRPYYLKKLYFALNREKCPSQFRDCWIYPSFQPDPSLERLVTRHPCRPDLLFLPMTDWHVRIQRTQHLARTFAAMGSRCFYLNPNLGREFPSTCARGPRVRASLIEPRVMELHVQIPSEPVFHHRLLTPGENRMVVAGLRRVIESTGPETLVQVVSSPLWLDIALQLREQHGFPIVYDCHDLLEGFGRFGQDIVRAEPALIRAADLVAFSSRWLMDRATQAAPGVQRKSLLLRNGVNMGYFHRNIVVRKEREPKVIGYAGALDFWLDAEALRLAAVRHPEWKFLLAGRIETPHIRPLQALPNVEFLGEMPYGSLPGFLARLDVGLIPFRRIPLTLATNPIKLYEYFGLGVPVASTRLPEVERYGSLVYLAEETAGFAEAVERAAAENDPNLRMRRIAVAEEESWQSRCALLEERIAEITRKERAGTFCSNELPSRVLA